MTKGLQELYFSLESSDEFSVVLSNQRKNKIAEDVGLLLSKHNAPELLWHIWEFNPASALICFEDKNAFAVAVEIQKLIDRKNVVIDVIQQCWNLLESSTPALALQYLSTFDIRRTTEFLPDNQFSSVLLISLTEKEIKLISSNSKNIILRPLCPRYCEIGLVYQSSKTSGGIVGWFTGQMAGIKSKEEWHCCNEVCSSINEINTMLRLKTKGTGIKILSFTFFDKPISRKQLMQNQIYPSTAYQYLSNSQMQDLGIQLT